MSERTDPLIPGKAVAAELGISTKILRALINNHKIDARRHSNPVKGGKPRVFVLRSELDRYKNDMPRAVAPVKHRKCYQHSVISSEIHQFV